MLKVIPVQAAVGLPLAHDITEIIPGKHKGLAFRRGHIIRQEDVAKLLDVGKANIYVMELEKDELHEEDGLGSRIGHGYAFACADYQGFHCQRNGIRDPHSVRHAYGPDVRRNLGDDNAVRDPHGLSYADFQGGCCQGNRR